MGGMGGMMGGMGGMMGGGGQQQPNPTPVVAQATAVPVAEPERTNDSPGNGAQWNDKGEPSSFMDQAAPSRQPTQPTQPTQPKPRQGGMGGMMGGMMGSMGGMMGGMMGSMGGM